MKKPQLQDDALLSDIERARNDRARLHLWWLGQSGFLVVHDGRALLLDPYLSDSLTHKYAQTDKPHVRMTERVVAPERLGFVQLVTSSHNHTDHLDAETLMPLLAAAPQLELIAGKANQSFAAERLKLDPSRLKTLDAGESLGIAGCVVHAVPAAHESLERDPNGYHRFLGYVIELGSWTIYHSGDTVRYEGMEAELKRWPIDVALLPINGRGPERRVAGNLWGHEAAQLAHDIGARWAVPCHYDMFAFNTASPADFVAACEQLRQPHRVLANGERWSLEA